MALEDIMLSEISQIKTNALEFHLYVGFEKKITEKDIRLDLWLPDAGGEWEVW